MGDIVERLRLYAQQFEDQHAPDHITLALRAGADEIERKDAEIASLLNTLADARTESMRLRAALEELLWYTNQLELAVYDPAEWPSTHGAVRAARAALEGRT